LAVLHLQQAFEDSKQKQAAALFQQAPSFARAMLQVYQSMQAFPASAAGSARTGAMRHCSFTPRDLTAWVDGLKRWVLGDIQLVCTAPVCLLRLCV
jgi:hypothetical protein